MLDGGPMVNVTVRVMACCDVLAMTALKAAAPWVVPAVTV